MAQTSTSGRLATFILWMLMIGFVVVVPLGANYGIYMHHHRPAEAFRERIVDAGYEIVDQTDGYDGRLNFRIAANGCEFYLQDPKGDAFDVYQWLNGVLIGESERTVRDDWTSQTTTYAVPYTQFTLETLRSSTFFKDCASRLR